MDEAGFFRSEETVSPRGFTRAYASNIVRTKPSSNFTTQEWKLNDLHCAAVTILQVALGITVPELKSIRDDDSMNKMQEKINSVLIHFPFLGIKLKKIISMLIDGEAIDKIARTYDDGTLSQENFSLINDSKAEASILRALKLKIPNWEMMRIVEMLAKRVNFGSVSYTHLTLPTIYSV
eukprot:TRINITY_DN18816_c0_g1_i1.p1 TRINITY_DN18816_c0_g1~~TRINITY_DN18816_c0_g1_i1.p1  ORF type:complete len:179 (+),score=11.08 TRINITY_DN18816_c0_g1_i1:3-539(+)